MHLLTQTNKTANTTTCEICRHFLDQPSVPPPSAGGGRRPRGQRSGLHLRGGSDAEEQAERAQDGSQPVHHRIRHL